MVPAMPEFLYENYTLPRKSVQAGWGDILMRFYRYPPRGISAFTARDPMSVSSAHGISFENMLTGTIPYEEYIAAGIDGTEIVADTTYGLTLTKG